MPSETSEPVDAFGLDVSLEDAELMDEVGLLGELMVALNDVHNRLSPREVDAILGL
jgi:hypothetical protein